jgi:hypothetical protein
MSKEEMILSWISENPVNRNMSFANVYLRNIAIHLICWKVEELNPCKL